MKTHTPAPTGSKSKTLNKGGKAGVCARKRLDTSRLISVSNLVKPDGTMVLPYPPSNNTYKRHYCTRSTRADPHPISAYLTEEARDYKAEAGWVAKTCYRGEPLRGELRLTMHAYRPRECGDIDNLLKVPLDALQGVAYENDSQIKEVHVFLHEHRPGAAAHLDVRLEVLPLEEPGARG